MLRYVSTVNLIHVLSLDAGGAEDLLGHGDMLFLGPGKIEPERVQWRVNSDDEVNRICDAWRERGEPNYVE